jgi:hypothetical protein
MRQHTRRNTEIGTLIRTHTVVDPRRR